jgi:DNA-binding transcriptional LysR family regulator
LGGAGRASWRGGGPPPTPDALAAHQTIQFGASSDWRFVKEGRDLRIVIAPRFVTNNADVAVRYAEAGGGLTRVLAYQAADAIKRGRLKIVLAKFEQPKLPMSAKVRAFIDLVAESSDWRFG